MEQPAPLVIPPFKPFSNLLERATRNPTYTILYDHESELSITSSQLLHSVLTFRDKIQKYLSEETLQKLRTGQEDVFICALVPSGWEFVAASLAILALGAAVVPLSPGILPEEAKYFIETSGAIAMIYRPSYAAKVLKMKASFQDSNSTVCRNFAFVDTLAFSSIPSNFFQKEENYKIDSSFQPNPSRAGSLLFTSGTTGPPKGVVHAYDRTILCLALQTEWRTNREGDLFLSRSPAHWAAGFFTVISTAVTGTCLEFCSSIFTPEWFWNRIKRGDVTNFFFIPGQQRELKEWFEKHIDGLPEEERAEYTKAITNLRSLNVVGAPLMPHIQEWWTEVRGGRPLLNIYTTTELLFVCDSAKQPLEENNKCPVGPEIPGVEIKLVDGEMLVKTPWMFTRYVSGDPNVSKDIYDKEGFFKTGDLAERSGVNYIIHGRASIDTIRFSGWKMHTTDIETALHALPYISTALAVGIEDEACHQRVGAIIGLRTHPSSNSIDLRRLRKDLTRTALQRYKFPTAVYWLRPGEELPMTPSGKISKVAAKKMFFGPDYETNERVEVRDLSLKEEADSDTGSDVERAWNWAGIAD